MKKKIVLFLALVVILGMIKAPNFTYAQSTYEISINYEESESESESKFKIATFAGAILTYDIMLIKTSGGQLKLTIDIFSPVGTATEIGVKNVWLRHKETGTSAYASQSAGPYVGYNKTSYAAGAIIDNPVSGYSYKFVGKIYAICNGVEYSEDFDTGWYEF